MKRPAWALANDLLRDYYDHEWGRPVRDTPGVFEQIALECFQAGLSWSTILAKRSAFRSAFAGFDPASVAAFTDDDVARLMTDVGIIRNQRKIRAVITNARATVAMTEAGDDLADLVWSFRPADPRAGAGLTSSDESAALSAELKRRGFMLVGPVTAFATMQAIGVLDHRLP